MNFLIDKGYGEMTILNLFPYVSVHTAKLVKRDKQYDNTNNFYLKEYCKEADMIVVAWGYDKNKYVERKTEVERLLLDYKDKVKCICDPKGHKPCHFRIIVDGSKLIGYF